MATQEANPIEKNCIIFHTFLDVLTMIINLVILRGRPYTWQSLHPWGWHTCCCRVTYNYTLSERKKIVWKSGLGLKKKLFTSSFVKETSPATQATRTMRGNKTILPIFLMFSKDWKTNFLLSHHLYRLLSWFVHCKKRWLFYIVGFFGTAKMQKCKKK